MAGYSLPVYGYHDPTVVDTSAAAVNPVAAGGFWQGIGDWFKNSGFSSSVDPETNLKIDGWGRPVVGGVSALLDAFMGMKEYGLAKNQLAENRRQFDMNFDAQRRTVNSALEDRQRARVRGNPAAYQSVGEYMDRYGIR